MEDDFTFSSNPRQPVHLTQPNQQWPQQYIVPIVCCPNKSRGCRVTEEEYNLEEHAITCQYRLRLCRNCGNHIVAKAFTTHNTLCTPMAPCKICHQNVAMADLPNHATTCGQNVRKALDFYNLILGVAAVKALVQKQKRITPSINENDDATVLKIVQTVVVSKLLS